MKETALLMNEKKAYAPDPRRRHLRRRGYDGSVSINTAVGVKSDTLTQLFIHMMLVAGFIALCTANPRQIQVRGFDKLKEIGFEPSNILDVGANKGDWIPPSSSPRVNNRPGRKWGGAYSSVKKCVGAVGAL